MDALIIAAGRGSRLAEAGDSKPLINVGGYSLIDHVMRAAARGGVTRFVVVCGWMAERVTEAVRNIATDLGLVAECITNPEWRHGNGISVLVAKGRVNSPFFLMMSDHLFDPGILSLLKKSSLRNAGVALAVDRRIENNPLVDLEDVTRVLEKDGRIRAIGKGLTCFNAFDTGLFCCTGDLFPALESSLKKGDESLSGGVRELAARGEAFALDAGKRFWLDVDDLRALNLARQWMRGGPE
ncbi:MAG: NTP transferase domain-containing protein [Candidatus Aminicenantes bacterium]|nr:NTP transferase domain-containing protein [Candidatus Aminicenantes bacterium]